MNIEEYANAIRPMDKYPDSKKPEVYALGISGEAGEVADKIKKVIRDVDSRMTDDIAKSIALEIGDVMWYCTRLAEHLGYSIEDILKMNVEKLNARIAKGTLAGGGKILSGDNR